MAKLSIIVAIDQKNGIGYNNQLLFKLPNDLKHFKKITSNHTVIMGRKTFESLPKGALPNRRNIVLSRKLEKPYTNTELYRSLDDALEHISKDEEVFIIGGPSLYKEGIELAENLYITEVHTSAKNVDTYFPSINKNEWKEISRVAQSADDKHLYSYSFVHYSKKN